MVLRDEQRRAATAGDDLDLVGHALGHDTIAGLAQSTPPGDGVARTLADAVLGVVDTTHARFCREWHESPFDASLVLRRSEPPRQGHDRAPLRRLISAAGQVSGADQLFHRHTRCREELGGLAIAECDRARLVEQ